MPTSNTRILHPDAAREVVRRPVWAALEATLAFSSTEASDEVFPWFLTVESEILDLLGSGRTLEIVGHPWGWTVSSTDHGPDRAFVRPDWRHITGPASLICPGGLLTPFNPPKSTPVVAPRVMLVHGEDGVWYALLDNAGGMHDGEWCSTDGTSTMYALVSEDASGLVTFVAHTATAGGV